MTVQAWNPSTWEMEAGSSSATLDFKVSLRCTDPRGEAECSTPDSGGSVGAARAAVPDPRRCSRPAREQGFVDVYYLVIMRCRLSVPPLCKLNLTTCSFLKTAVEEVSGVFIEPNGYPRTRRWL